ncbi:hypothetical protein [Stenotrophomonas indicatrix]|uniref:hypothetical protein n=1 Tax=Stenotrophomonas indicatrix TaxID=2045451 RepID=UPI0011875DA7|nr:hypothetical protein [Stenotrophomonas indicatrix]
MDAWVEKCASSSKGGLRRRAWVAGYRCLTITIAALVLSACSSGAPALSHHLNQRQSVKSGSETGIERFKNDVERLTSVRFDDVDALNEQLHTHLGEPIRQGLRDERIAECGRLGDLEVRNITLRSAADDPAHANLIFEVVPPSIALEEINWEDSTLYPPHPNAPGSRPYWSVQVNSATVVLGLASDNVTLTYVSIRQR